MKSFSNNKVLFYLSCSCMVLFSITVLFMPYASKQAENSSYLLLYINSAVFWIFLVLGYLLFFVLNFRRHKAIRDGEKKKEKTKLFPGALRFFSNQIAGMFDSIFILSLLFFIYYQVTTYIDGLLSYLLLSVVLLSFHMHCMFNGKNYKFYVN